MTKLLDKISAKIDKFNRGEERLWKAFWGIGLLYYLIILVLLLLFLYYGIAVWAYYDYMDFFDRYITDKKLAREANTLLPYFSLIIFITISLDYFWINSVMKCINNTSSVLWSGLGFFNSILAILVYIIKVIVSIFLLLHFIAAYITKFII